MKYQYVFQWLDGLVSERLNPKSEAYAHLTKEVLSEYAKRVEKEAASIQATLKKELFCIKNERALELRIEQYQTTLIRLLDEVYQQSKGSSAMLEGLYATLKTALEALLHFIEQHFNRYFNQDQCVPRSYWQISRKWLLQQCKKLSAIPPSEPADALTIPLVLRILQPLLNKESISYRQKTYLETLMSQVMAEEGKDSPEQLFTHLQEQLLYLNFNHAEMVSLLVKQMEIRASACVTHEEKRALLHGAMQYIRKLPLKPGFALFPDLPPAPTFLLEWIQFEIDFIQAQSQQTAMHTPTPADEQDTKIQLSVSVAMLGLFLRLLTEEGIITNKNQSGLVRFFANHCTTTRQNEISSDSLYGSYFKPQPGTVRMMKECLLRMQGLLHKKF